MYWECHRESVETEKLLSDIKLIKFISPHNENVNKDEVIFDRLNHFENYIFKLRSENNKMSMTRNIFTETAKNYFDNFKVEIDLVTEREHQEFIKSLDKK